MYASKGHYGDIGASHTLMSEVHDAVTGNPVTFDEEKD
jgi:hypothetical protein